MKSKPIAIPWVVTNKSDIEQIKTAYVKPRRIHLNCRHGLVLVKEDLAVLFHYDLQAMVIKYISGDDLAEVLFTGLKGALDIQILKIVLDRKLNPLLHKLSYQSRLGNTLKSLCLKHLVMSSNDIQRLCHSLPFFSNLEKLIIDGLASYHEQAAQLYTAGLHATISFDSDFEYPTGHGMLLLLDTLKKSPRVASGTFFRLRSVREMIPNYITNDVLERCFAAAVIRHPGLSLNSKLMNHLERNEALAKVLTPKD